ncbi:MAG: O-methyltransferase [Endozoicomonas sp. (ex Botrylloides leachii)]|nr:O-methyltransferase [Endozoicomonas sp. (ex Botrylloides leachii)]
MDVLVNPLIEQYCEDMTSGESALLKELAKITYQRTRYPHNMSGRLVGQTLKLLATLTHSRVILEVGMFTGYAALSMAEGIAENAVVYCCETNPRAISIAQSFFDRSPHGHKIKVLFGRALDTIPEIAEPLDMVFLDADKKAYFDYLECILPMLKQGGIIVIDDALWRGRVLSPTEARDQVIADLNSHIVARNDVENVLLPVRHGLNILRKL